MAEYHLTVGTIGRSAGRSSIAAAAYRSGTEITDERTGLVHDFTKKGGVLGSEIILPGGGTADRAEFWNGIEKHHKRGDAVLVREMEISLPRELTDEQRKDLAVSYVKELTDRYGVAADVALHAPRTVTDRDLEKKPDQYHEIDPVTGRRHNGNWHAHIMLSACHVQPDGTLGKKAVELDPIHCQKHRIVNMVERERPRWGDLANAALERHGHDARIDHRSHAERGIEAEPTRHLGPAAAGIERRTGEKSEKRVGFEQAVTDRLARAKELGQLERERAALGSSIIDLSGDLNAAKAEQERQKQADKPRSRTDDLWAQLRTPKQTTEPPAERYGHTDDSDSKAATKFADFYGGNVSQPSARPAERHSNIKDSDIEEAIKFYGGAWGSPPSTPKPPGRETDAPKEVPDWSQFRSFAGAKAEPVPTQPEGDKAVYPPPSGPGYFPETKEERQRDEEEAAGGRLLRVQDSTRTDELWERMKREEAEREEKNRERDSGPDFDR